MRRPVDIRRDLVKLADELLEESRSLQETAHFVREEGIRIRQAAVPDHRSRERSGDGPGPILVVDDDPGSLKLLRVLLQGEGYAVQAVSDATLALLAVQETPPRLIVTDLYMPGMSGITLIRRLKADASTRTIKPIRSDTFVSLIKTVIGADGPTGRLPPAPRRVKPRSVSGRAPDARAPEPRRERALTSRPGTSSGRGRTAAGRRQCRAARSGRSG